MAGENRNDFEPLMTVDEAAEYLRLKPGTVRQWVKLKQIPFVKVGRNTRFRRSAIEAWLTEHPAESEANDEEAA